MDKYQVSQPRSLPVMVVALWWSVTAHSDGVKVVSLQEDIWTPYAGKVYARYNFNSGQVLENLTVCYRLMPTTYALHTEHLSLHGQNDILEIATYLNRLRVVYNGKMRVKALREYSHQLPLARWSHFCHVFQRQHYTLYINGREAVSGLMELEGSSSSLTLDATLVLGQEQDERSGGFNVHQRFLGRITQMNFWQRVFSHEEVKSLALCEQNISGDVFSTDANELEMVGGAFTFEVALKDLCTTEDRYVIFPEEHTIAEGEAFCQRLGSSVYTPRNFEASKKLYQDAMQFANVYTNALVFLGASDQEEETVWRDKATGEEITNMTQFFSDRPNPEQNCLYLTKLTGVWEDIRCESGWWACTVCDTLHPQVLILRGLCYQNPDMIHFFVDGYKNDKPFFHGAFGYNIYYEGLGQWRLWDSQSNKTVARLELPSSSLYPLGRHTWTTPSPVCKRTSSTVVLSLSSCTHDQFMCRSGDCVENEARCDLYDHCPDKSDEDNCSVVKFPPEYKGDRPPRGFVESDLLLLSPTVYIFRVVKVSDLEQSFTALLVVETRWQDPRLTYHNLNDNFYLNKLSLEDKGRLWIPRYSFQNAYDGDIHLLREEVYVEKIGNASIRDFNVVNMDTIYESNSASLNVHQSFFGSFTCDLDIVTYPFDHQHCDVQIVFTSLHKQHLAFRNVQVLYRGSQMISSYEIGNFSAATVNDSLVPYFCLQVRFSLRRQYERIVLVMFLPSFMLVIIGYATLYIKLGLLQVRLTVSLTTLLVLYTLSDQISSHLPQTSYLKIIDYWFFSCIFLLFSIILFHVFIEFIDSPSSTQEGVWSDRALAQVTTTRSHKTVKLIRLVIPAAAVIFNVIFWVVILTNKGT
ncbi:Glutamate-gated chloride channel-like 9 [Homarus americanus]|uniref:Glutamate-gated chloride channel-like 9 n=1 Tax=Homarus americanus TaxID=6706 RepID=A0A8J5MYA8_HOMAM|nr:Glutamate-gated chloride channel-like 9 [Homarus americanus]